MKLVLALVIVAGSFATGCGSKPSAPAATSAAEDAAVQPAEAPAAQVLPEYRPRFTIGKDTTYVLGPVDEDGYIDYIAALNEKLREGVTPDNNAMVVLCKALGPHPEGATMPAEFYEWLEIPSPPEKGEYFVWSQKFIREHLQDVSAEANNVFNAELEQAKKRPWKALRYPQVAEWLKHNEKSLAVVIEATQRSHFFYPMVPRERKSGVMAALIPHIVSCRELSAALLARAMLSADEGRLEDAWRDLLACHRLARLLGRGGSLIACLVGFAIDTATGEADLAFLERAGARKKLAQDCLRDMQQLPPLPQVADHIDLSERFAFLDLAMHVGRVGMGHLESLTSNKPVKRTSDPLTSLFWDTIDWDPALRKANQWYDRLATAMRLADRAAREKQLDELSSPPKESMRSRGY